MKFMKEEDVQDNMFLKLIKKKKMLLGCILILLVVASAIFVMVQIKRSNGEKVHTISKASLEKMLEISDLSTLDFTYNAIANVNDENGKPKYHVAYKGTVTAGIDFSQIGIAFNEKVITITIPEASVQNVDVDMGTMNFIFEKKKYETETVSQEAYAACREDLDKRAAAEPSLLSMAKENATEAVKALVEPWVQQVDKEYTVEIK